MKILVLNGGSSSLKASLMEVQAPLSSTAPTEIWRATAEWGLSKGSTTFKVVSEGKTLETTMKTDSRQSIVEQLLDTLADELEAKYGAVQIDAVGHRIVFGGVGLRKTILLTPKITAEIELLSEFAPEHNPLAVTAIRGVEQKLGSNVKQIAVFDSSFHAAMPRAATVYPGPYEWIEKGIERLGFHGISHGYMSRRAAEMLEQRLESMRIVTCHLGNGCSLAAVQNGRSIDTTMGFTPMEGMMMGTRAGSIDSGILLHLLRKCGFDADSLDRLLNKESGLKGISGSSGDMRRILEAMHAGDERAKLAFDVFSHRLCREIGAMIGSLGGIDALVFGGGIGENTPSLREIVGKRFDFLGVKIDSEKNAQFVCDSKISSPESKIPVLVIHTEEDWEIARECYGLLAGKPN